MEIALENNQNNKTNNITNNITNNRTNNRTNINSNNIENIEEINSISENNTNNNINDAQTNHNEQSFFRRAINIDFTFLISYLIAFTQGTGTLFSLNLNYIFKDVLQLSPAAKAQISSLGSLPWMIKPLFGLISDSFPICGYRRKSYILIFLSLMILSNILMHFFYKVTSYVVLCSFIGSFSMAFCNVIGEALIVETCNEKGLGEASKQVSNFFTSRAIGSILTAFLSGYILEVVECQNVVFISCLFPLIVIIFTCFRKEKIHIKEDNELLESSDLLKPGQIDLNDRVLVSLENESEDNVESSENYSIGNNLSNKLVDNDNSKNSDRDKDNNVIDSITDNDNDLDNKTPYNKNNIDINTNETTKTIITNIDDNTTVTFKKVNIETKASALSSVTASAESNKKVHLDLKSQIKLLWSFIKQDFIYKPILFIFIISSMPGTGDAFFYYYTNELNFTKSQMGNLSFSYGVSNLIGIYIYKRWLKKYNFKQIIFGSSVVSWFFGFLSLIVVMRWNLKLGISDFVFCIGSDSIQVVIAEINLMPILVLAAHMCPKNIEGTVYALLMSVSNAGGFASYNLGALLTYLLGITSTSFDRLWLLVIISNSLVLIPLFLLYWVDEEEIAKNLKLETDKHKEGE